MQTRLVKMTLCVMVIVLAKIVAAQRRRIKVARHGEVDERVEIEIEMLVDKFVSGRIVRWDRE
jgi:hypothetical protein